QAWHLDRMDRRARVAAPTEVQRRLTLLLLGDSDLHLFLARLDRQGARRGFDHVFPFYDRRVLEVLLATPAHLRADHGIQKNVLRQAMRGILPELVRTRRDAADFTPWVEESMLGPHREAHRAAFAE